MVHSSAAHEVVLDDWSAYKKTVAWSLGRQKIGTATTDENGVIVREDLTAGTYEVTELDAPEPYRNHVDRNPRTIEIQDMHDAVPITITNQADGMRPARLYCARTRPRSSSSTTRSRAASRFARSTRRRGTP